MVVRVATQLHGQVEDSATVGATAPHQVVGEADVLLLLCRERRILGSVVLGDCPTQGDIPGLVAVPSRCTAPLWR